jgi:hypothetical protein
MAWREMTEADILQRISGTELDIMRQALLARGQADPVASQIALTTDYVRGFVAAYRRNQLGPAGTLPESLMLPACDILIVDLNTRAGGVLIDDSGERSRSKATAVSMLRNDVATGKFSVEDPGTGTQNSGSAVSLQKRRQPRMTHTNLRGF